MYDGVEYIGINAFANCHSLKSIMIPSSVETIQEYALGYKYSNAKQECEVLLEPIEDFTIYGYTGTSAETYALENGITFVALDKPITIKGDANGDGKLAASDAAFIAKALAEASINSKKITVEDYPLADFNDDGKVTAKYAADIASYLAKQSIT